MNRAVKNYSRQGNSIENASNRKLRRDNSAQRTDYTNSNIETTTSRKIEYVSETQLDSNPPKFVSSLQASLKKDQDKKRSQSIEKHEMKRNEFEPSSPVRRVSFTKSKPPPTASPVRKETPSERPRASSKGKVLDLDDIPARKVEFISTLAQSAAKSAKSTEEKVSNEKKRSDSLNLPFKSSLMNSEDKTTTKPFQSSLKTSLAAATAKPETRSSLPEPFIRKQLSTSTKCKQTDEEKRKEITEKLKQKFENRKLERQASSLTSDGKQEFRQTNLCQNNTSIIESRKVESVSEKKLRTEEYYARLDAENKEKEAARRAVPFISSLAKSLTTIAASETFQSSLVRNIAQNSRRRNYDIKKKKYTLIELQQLLQFAIAPQSNELPDMQITTELVEQNHRAAHGSRSPGDRSSRHSSNYHQKNRRRAQDHRQYTSRGYQSSRHAKNGDRSSKASPTPLFDGPVEPIVHSENRWVAHKSEPNTINGTVSVVRGLLNKLTREKFDKITDALCLIEVNTISLLLTIITILMEKAIEEPAFADIYADICKAYHTRMYNAKQGWSFLKVVESTSTENDENYFWTAIDPTDYNTFCGPYSSVWECLESAVGSSGTGENKSISLSVTHSAAKFYFHQMTLVCVIESTKNTGVFYYSKPQASNTLLNTMEGSPFVLGSFPTEADAIKDAIEKTSIKNILVNRCQREFDLRQSLSTKGDNQFSKSRMLGNIRFIGELYKCGIVESSMVQDCLTQLLGLNMVIGDNLSENKDVEIAESVRIPCDDDISALCKLLTVVGRRFDQPQHTTAMNIFILRLVELSKNKDVGSRSRFMIEDVLEMRDHMWEPRRKELEKKTLSEVRREAQQLQKQGKNAQHDTFANRRHKKQVSSAQVATLNSNLLVHRHSEGQAQLHTNESQPDIVTVEQPALADEEVTINWALRAKGIIEEYITILDLSEAITCVEEFPIEGDARAIFAEECINKSMEGNEKVRDYCVTLLVELYEHGALDATAIQDALLICMELIEDLQIDLPRVHEYAALLFGRLITAGCFGFSWMTTVALVQAKECGLAATIFVECLTIVEHDTSVDTVQCMLDEEEISLVQVLPTNLSEKDDEIDKFIEKHALEVYFGDDDENDLDIAETEDTNGIYGDPILMDRLRNIFLEYTQVHDIQEVITCVRELNAQDYKSSNDDGVISSKMWLQLIYCICMYSFDGKETLRAAAAQLIIELHSHQTVSNEIITATDVESVMESILGEFEDLIIDIPQIAKNIVEIWTPLVFKSIISMSWLGQMFTQKQVITNNRLEELFSALLVVYEAQYGKEELESLWKDQGEAMFAIWGAINGEPECEK